MSIFRFPVAVQKVVFDEYGDPRVIKGVAERCAILIMRVGTEHTTVRVDAGGSRGYADEEVSDLLILVPATTKINNEDLLVIAGETFKVTQKHPRFGAIAQRLEHYEIKGAYVAVDRQG